MQMQADRCLCLRILRIFKCGRTGRNLLSAEKDGFTTIKKASDNPIARKLCEAGDLPGTLWKQGLLVEG